MKAFVMLLCGALAAALLAACQTWGPAWSEISGSRYNVTDLNRTPTIIRLVDGSNPGPRIGYGGYSFYKIEPGKHTLTLGAFNRTPNWVSGINRQEWVLDVEPCKRYYINAQFDNVLLADWKPIIDYTEPIAGCGVRG